MEKKSITCVIALKNGSTLEEKETSFGGGKFKTGRGY